MALLHAIAPAFEATVSHCSYRSCPGAEVASAMLLMALAAVPVACRSGGGGTASGPSLRAAKDPRPIFAEAALPAVGSRIPSFDLPTLAGRSISDAGLAGQAAFVVLWSTGCIRSREALADVERIRRAYSARGVRVVILADDADTSLVRAVLTRGGIRDTAASGLEVGIAAGRLTSLFDRSVLAPDSLRRDFRIQYVAPGFLVVDATGIVRYRGAIQL